MSGVLTFVGILLILFTSLVWYVFFATILDDVEITFTEEEMEEMQKIYEKRKPAGTESESMEEMIK